MDHWGDPWADGTTNDDKSPTKNQIPSPLPPAQPSAPGLLNGFLDDAGWGNDESFGEWTTPSGNEDSTPAPTAHIVGSSAVLKDEDVPSYSDWGKGFEREEQLHHGGTDWSMPTTDEPEHPDIGHSETSNSSSTIRADDALGSIETDITIQVSADDSSSAHPSIFSSESSQNEARTETPRTSIEEEHDHDKHVALIQELDEDLAKKDEGEIIEPLSRQESISVTSDYDSETVQKEASCGNADSGHTESLQYRNKSPVEDFGGEETARDESVAAARSRRTAAAVTIDQGLLDELFPEPQNKLDLSDTHEDPIYSTAGRKAWYRLTRKQTLREYNSGAADDNHIRVTWANSHIRSEINKIVGRWAREDRISGTGAGARASFYWDTTAPVDPKGMKHNRKRSSISMPRGFTPIRQSLPALPTNAPAAFSWSNPSVPNTRKIDPPVLASSTTVQKNNAAYEVDSQLQNASQMQILPPVTAAPVPSILIPPPIPRLPVSTPDPSVTLKDTGTEETVQTERAIEPNDDDDDDWGEMVTGVNESSPVKAESPFRLMSPNNTFSTSSSPIFSADASLFQDQSADPNPARIVRLKSTISPTSTLFAQRFIPLHAEQGPIGPGILKRFNRSASDTPGKRGREVQSLLNSEPVTVEPNEKETMTFDWSDSVSPQKTTLLGPPSSNHEEDEDLLNITSKTSKLDTFDHPPPPQEPPISIQPNIDSWTVTDFSFFDAAPPAETSTPSQAKPGPSDPFSVFETPQMLTQSIFHEHQPVENSTSRNSTPPLMPPPTNAALKSTMQQKEEDDHVIEAILKGLPDLRYMLV